ncbi:glycine/D-amino acid oxidase-like deaminating enzyme/nitrite reductase/ring-hydroxylating ferredoxin subunit [Lederbergia wuyishanensis]|uniref:Glycine/D-amino acid oxidase-like deaminating enzyme/nitrite reductase/ring-hydroxylating ferredoxin subunit n=1 Tax=Lederbergia wuyishanensis TaxID=1347903 RepID=A0ABU0D0L6_9BACI|nr:FAD-dependent oxidoreductase [Lederbergia wuyishanensis]MCJ8006554.1 FAD-dependent oxidoreductase [Lederbergia wuyishanensis]MDQ0341933.1 glycine/D-amino acid oxidase-like deaminating enzyme/nitrite reductase/ring-hydroxylating ferredoxin subunit [Lederbergia wuyishanensis]
MNIQNNGEGKLPDQLSSYWLKSTNLPSFPQIKQDLNVDVAIIGGGITGITTAYLLVKEGYQVTVIEASTILNGTTGHTTAKVTAQHGLIYDELIQHFGEEKARLYYEANKEAAEQIAEIIKLHGIDCDYKTEDAYVYTNSNDYVQNLKKEYEAYKRLGIKGDFVDSIPLDLGNIKGAVVMKNQAQFHPLQYLSELVDFIKDSGGEIYEQSVATHMDIEDKPIVHLKNGAKITAQHVISATHFPFHDNRGYFARLHPERSYVVAAKPEKSFSGGMYINAEKPTRSIRSVKVEGEEILLFSGDGHKTGQGEPEKEHYESLEKFAKEEFGAKEILYRWSAQDLVTEDKLPFIGCNNADDKRVLVATGYRKWGMTTSMVAAQLMKDILIGKENRYEEIFSPSRFTADPGIKTIVKQNMNVAANLISGKFERPDKEMKDIKEGEGAVVSIKGGRAGAYKTMDGQLYVVDTTCTHMGCEVNWNSADQTWDCPCHGSRFSIEGDVIEGPAERPLKKIDPNSIDYTTS